jgi:hypothetical protein
MKPGDRVFLKGCSGQPTMSALEEDGLGVRIGQLVTITEIVPGDECAYVDAVNASDGRTYNWAVLVCDLAEQAQ